ncbi:PREDICTED: spectrin alpha chain, non-erythrocytic 1-like, partial [Amphimedon queenslandica]|uniref:SH3 domain-containing protein n=1 Tax=Amphimedon queenslandica TaxID=400682 RepID=A0AAN0JUN4_AMPQE
ETAESRKQVLEDSYEAQKYFSDALAAELWMKDIEPVVGSSDYGKDEDMAEALLKKHETVFADVKGFGSTIEALSAQSAKCQDTVSDVSLGPGAGESEKTYVKAVYSYGAHSAREVSVKKGEILALINSSNKEWWKVETSGGKQGFLPANYVKKVSPSVAVGLAGNASLQRRVSFNVAMETGPQESVVDRQARVKRKYANLERLADDRRQRLEESKKRFVLSRELNELKHWITDKAAFVSSEEAGKDLEHVEALKKKFESFQAELTSNEAKLTSITTMAEGMVQEGHTDAEEIQGELEDLNSLWETLVQSTASRKHQLEEAYNVQKFIRAADETKLWMNEKSTSALSDDYGRDLASVQALQRKHEGLERDLDALEEKVKSVTVESGALSRSYPQAAKQVKSKEKEVLDAWNHLKGHAEARKVKLVDSYDLSHFVNEEPKISEVQKFADQLVQSRHYAAVEIAERRASVLSAWAKLKQSLVDWRSRLGQSQSLQQFNREVDEIDAWLGDKLQTAGDESYRDPTNLENKLQKHETFESEVEASKERVFGLVQAGKDLIESQQCPGQEGDIQERIGSLEEQWEKLINKTNEKTQKLKEANQERQFNEGIRDLDYWLQETEAKLSSDDLGRDIDGVEALAKKHQLLEAELLAQQDRIKDLKAQSMKFMEDHHFDAQSIQAKQRDTEARFGRLQQLAKGRKAKLEDSLTLHQFYGSINDEEAWIKEKKLLVSSTDYGKDLLGVQRHLNNHRKLEDELNTHEQALKSLLSQGDKLASSDHYAMLEIKEKCSNLQDQWQDLNNLASKRHQKLLESLSYQEFSARVSEEESWLSEKLSLTGSDDYGNSLAAVQSLLKKHEAFETDVVVHQGRIAEMEETGEKLTKQDNYQAKQIKQKLTLLKSKMKELESAGKRRQAGLQDSKNCLQFYWEADTVESWIKNKHGQLHSDDHGRDILSVQALLTKHETFEASLSSYKKEGIDNLTQVKDDLISTNHSQSRSITQRHTDVMRRWDKLQKDSDAHKARLQRALDQFKKVEELFRQFAEKASAFSIALSNIEEDLADPVRCNSLHEIESIRGSHQQLQQQVSICRNDLKQISTLDRQIKSYSTSASNP